MQETSPIFDPLLTSLQTLGLDANPFDSRYLDAGADSGIAAYLVGHQAFDAIWKDESSFVFAPMGGGKSSFRVRLTHACRIGQDGRRIFPVVYKLPEPHHFDNQPTVLEQHFHFITQKMATELLLLLLYRPEKWNGIQPAEQWNVAVQLWFALPIDPISLIEQLHDAGNYSPLLALYDPTASQLPAQPHAALVQAVCHELHQIFAQLAAGAISASKLAPRQQFETLVETVCSIFDHEAIYLLVDGVDAYVETAEHPRHAVELLEPLWLESALLDTPVYFKYFLPTELKPAVTIERILPFGAIVQPVLVDIHWTEEWLLELLAARMRVASQGKFDNLSAVSIPALRNVHQELVGAVRNSPREVLVLAERLLWEHAHRPRAAPRLETEDLQRALAWYRGQPHRERKPKPPSVARATDRPEPIQEAQV